MWWHTLLGYFNKGICRSEWLTFLVPGLSWMLPVSIFQIHPQPISLSSYKTESYNSIQPCLGDVWKLDARGSLLSQQLPLSYMCIPGAVCWAGRWYRLIHVSLWMPTLCEYVCASRMHCFIQSHCLKWWCNSFPEGIQILVSMKGMGNELQSMLTVMPCTCALPSCMSWNEKFTPVLI